MRLRRVARVMLPLVLAAAAGGATAATLKALLLQRADDTRLERSRTERTYLGHPGGPAADGVNVALRESQFELEAARSAVALERVDIASLQAAKDAAAQAQKSGHSVLLTDLPADWTLAAADATKLPLLNIGEASDRLREADCRARLFHLPPSDRMRADALAQTLLARRWSQVLLLAGSGEADRVRSGVAQAAIKRYGLKLAAVKTFKLSADPRERDAANVALLTQGSYDAVWVVDSDGEFARTLPYRTALPRPVVGDAGLVALAWHAQFERFGAPQVSRRFAKAVGRAMTAHDWAAWLAGKALAAVALAGANSGDAAAKLLAGIELDGSKGVALSFRAWDGQLRQPLLLTDGQGVIAVAPVDGVLHPSNNLDTLGADAPERLCKGR